MRCLGNGGQNIVCQNRGKMFLSIKSAVKQATRVEILLFQ
jgi:hypothetical protein